MTLGTTTHGDTVITIHGTMDITTLGITVAGTTHGIMEAGMPAGMTRGIITDITDITATADGTTRTTITITTIIITTALYM